MGVEPTNFPSLTEIRDRAEGMWMRWLKHQRGIQHPQEDFFEQYAASWYAALNEGLDFRARFRALVLDKDPALTDKEFARIIFFRSMLFNYLEGALLKATGETAA